MTSPNEQNPYSTPHPWNLVAKGYAEATMQALGEYAKEAVALARLTRAARVLDVACGPGTVPLMIASDVQHVDAIDFAPDMVALLNEQLRRRDITNVNAIVGDGQALPYANDSFDAAFSMFGLMFFPDRAKGFSELHRTLKNDGRALVTSWAPVTRSPMMLLMFDAIRMITNETTSPAKAMKSLEDPDVFKSELEQAGFQNVAITPVTKHLSVSSAEEFWDRMVKGSAPIVMLRKKIGEKIWSEKEGAALQEIKKKLTKFPTMLSSDAWLGTGVKRARA